MVLHTTFSNGPDLEDPYDLYGIEVDPQQLNATIETCAELSEDACPPCLYAMMIGEGIPLETITCDDAP